LDVDGVDVRIAVEEADRVLTSVAGMPQTRSSQSPEKET
jgi:hypothetical protein